ncbi:serine hydrolase [Candidatus Obscuribacterales bacterium]|nr:serine hydrolase [Candidatus Obscuribacterales bacterium]
MPSGTTGTNRAKRGSNNPIEIPSMVAARQKASGAAVNLQGTISGGSTAEVLEAFNNALAQSDSTTYSDLQAHSKSEALSDLFPADHTVQSWEVETQNDLKTIGGTFVANQERSGKHKVSKQVESKQIESKATAPPVKALKFSNPLSLIGLFSSKKAKKKKKRWRPAPPGQKLIKGIVVACLLLLAQALYHLGVPVDLSQGRAHQIKLQPPFQLTTELSQLQKELTGLHAGTSIDAGVFAINLDNGQYVDSHGRDKFSSASMIKLPILVSLLMAVERGECTMDDELEIRQDLITSGSGILQWKPVGTKLSVKRAAQLMIIVSDNTATNMLIDKLGGFDRVNKDFHRWGLKQTKVNNWLVDVEGTNTTCPYDLVYLLGRVDHGELVNPEHRAFMYDIMGHCKNRSLLVPGLGPGAKIIHKTGTIGIMVGDAGIVTTSGGTRYAVSIQCQRKRNDTHANNFIREASRRIYNEYSTHPASPKLKEFQAEEAVAAATDDGEPAVEPAHEQPRETRRHSRKRKRRK